MIKLPREPEREELELVAVLHALSEPVRLSIVTRLARDGQVACGAFDLQAPKSSLSHHFRVLRESGVIATRREGKELLNTLRTADLDERFPGLLRAVLHSAGG